MFRRSLLPVVRPRPSDAPGLLYDEGIEEDGIILSGTTRVPATGETYPVKNGYLDLLKGRLGGDNVANLTNFLPGAGRGYEPLWRVRSPGPPTGEDAPNQRAEGGAARHAARAPAARPHAGGLPQRARAGDPRGEGRPRARRPLPRPRLLRGPLHPQPRPLPGRHGRRRRHRHLSLHAPPGRPPGPA